MRHINHIVSTVFLLLMVFSYASLALSIDKESAKRSVTKSANTLQSYVWYDGRQQRTVWLNPGLVAEFRNKPSEASLVAKKYPAASIKYDKGSVRIWQLPAQQSAGTLLNRGASSDSIPAVHSPVFHDAPTESGQMRTLPGNVIVYLNPDWDHNHVTRWMKNRGFEVEKKLEIRQNAYVLKTGSGMEALQTANALYESGEVVAAFPDWWLESVLR